jgi:hypothetical protein
VHQAGIENPWTPIQTREEFLDENVTCVYRAYMESEAGEARNNIIRLVAPGRDITDLDLSVSDAPSGMEVKQGIEWHGPHSIAQVLIIEISPDVHPGQYSFGIGIEIDGKDYGTVPCTIEVSNLSKIAIQPPPGSYLGSPDDELSKIVLNDVQFRREVCDKDYSSPWFPSVKKGEPCLVVRGHIQNQDKEKFHIGMTALGYDEAGEAVSGTLDAAHISGAIGLYLEYEETGEFTMHLNLSDNISTIRIFAQGASVPLP